MNLDGPFIALAIISPVIQAIIEIIKAWIPAKNKNNYGVIFKYRGRVITLPNAALWPTLAMFMGVAVCIFLQLDFLQGILSPEQDVKNAGEAISGVASGLGASGANRIRGRMSTALAGTTTDTMDVGPASQKIEQIASVIDGSAAEQLIGQASSNTSRVISQVMETADESTIF